MKNDLEQIGKDAREMHSNGYSLSEIAEWAYLKGLRESECKSE